MMWNSRSIEIILALPNCDFFITHLREQSSQFHIQHIKPEEFDNITAEQWAKADILITDRQTPKPEIAPNLKWIQFYRLYDIETVNTIREYYPKIIFTSSVGVDVYDQIAFCMHKMFAPIEEARQLYHATIGIIGYDSLGRELARVLKPFHCTILAATFNAMNPVSDTYQPQNTGDEEGILFDRLYPIQALPSMLSSCNVVVNTLSLSNASHNFFTGHMLDKVKPGTLLLDLSHPGVSDHDEIISLAKEGKFRYFSTLEKPQNTLIGARYEQNFLELLRQNLTLFIDKQPLLNEIR